MPDEFPKVKCPFCKSQNTAPRRRSFNDWVTYRCWNCIATWSVEVKREATNK